MKNKQIAAQFNYFDRSIHYRIAGSLRIVSLTWIGAAIVYVVGRLDSLNLSPWDSVRVAALMIGPGALGVLLSLIVESIGFSRRNR